MGTESQERTGAAYGGIPHWVWTIALALAAVQPILHIWLVYFPPPGTAPTGLAVNDTVVFRHCLRMLLTGFETHHATCQSPWGDHDIRFYSSPLHWLYGLLGPIGAVLRIPEFLYLGLLNGLGTLAYLVAAFSFLRRAVPRLAPTAWLLFVITTGPGGIAYMVSGVLGLHHHAEFEQVFWRFAYYDLTEAAQMWPMLHSARLYYTLPLATGLWALGRFIGLASAPFNGRSWILPLAAMGFTTFFNIRVGPMLGLIAACYLLCREELSWARRMQSIALFLAPIAAGLAVASWMLSARPSYVENANAMAATVMWLTPFLYAAGFHLALAAWPVLRTVPHQNGLARLATCAGLGYGIAFAVLFLGYQAYYGNWWYGGDGTGALAVSDWALMGVCIGVAVAFALPRITVITRDRELDWIALWLILFVAAAPSLLGHGWLLRLSPQRLMVLMGLPLCVLAAAGLSGLAQRHRFAVRIVLGGLVACGVTSIFVSWFVLQGPMGPRPGEGPYAFLSVGLMSDADARLLDALAPGATLAPAERQPFFGDVVSLRPGGEALFGTGTLDLSTLLSLEMRASVEHFFAQGTTDDERLAFVREWCVVNVLCPDSVPVAPEVRAALGALPWLEVIDKEGDGVVFRVVEPDIR